MTYIRVEQAHTDDERWIEAGADAFALHIAALVYCDRLLTDGRISLAMALRVSLAVPTDRAKAAVDVLVALGFWIKDGDGYRIVDFPSHAFPAEQIQRTRDRWANDKRRRQQHDIGDHELCKDPKFCPAIRDGSTLESAVDSTVDSAVTPPVDAHAYTKPNSIKPNQTRPEGSGAGIGGSAHAATPSARRSHDPQDKDGGLTWVDEDVGVMTLEGGLVTVTYFEGGTSPSSTLREWQMAGGKIPDDAQPLNKPQGKSVCWTDDAGAKYTANDVEVSFIYPPHWLDVIRVPRGKWEAAGHKIPANAVPAESVDPWTAVGDCEHLEGGLDRSRILDKLRCKQCDKHEKAQAKVRAMRAAS